MSAPVDVLAVHEANKRLSEAYKALAAAEGNYATVKALNGQVGYSVTVNGVRVDVACMDSQTYMATLVRGREMIHLGALKALQSIIQSRRDEVVACEALLARLAGGCK